MDNQKNKGPARKITAKIIIPSKKSKNDKRLLEKNDSSTPSYSTAIVSSTTDKQPSKKQKTNQKEKIVPLELARLRIGTSLLRDFVPGTRRIATTKNS